MQYQVNMVNISHENGYFQEFEKMFEKFQPFSVKPGWPRAGAKDTYHNCVPTKIWHVFDPGNKFKISWFLNEKHWFFITLQKFKDTDFFNTWVLNTAWRHIHTYTHRPRGTHIKYHTTDRQTQSVIDTHTQTQPVRAPGKLRYYAMKTKVRLVIISYTYPRFLFKQKNKSNFGKYGLKC